MIHLAMPKIKYSVSFKALIFITFSLLLHACGGGGESDSSKPSAEVSIKGTLGKEVVDSASATSFLPQTQSPVTSQDSAVTSEDLVGFAVVLATTTDGNTYQTQTNKDRKFDLKVPAGKSYVLMFLNSVGRFIGVFVHNTSLPTAAYTVASDTDIGTVVFRSNGKATSDKAEEMAKKRDAKTKEEYLPKKPSEIKTSGDKVSFLPFSSPEGSYSYFIEKDSDSGNSTPFIHTMSYESIEKFNGVHYSASSEFEVCRTAKFDDACENSDSFGLHHVTLSQVTATKGFEELHKLKETSRETPDTSIIPPVFDRKTVVKGSYKKGEGKVEFDAKLDSTKRKKNNEDGKSYDYMLLKITHEFLKKETTQYLWFARGFGEVGSSDSNDELPKRSYLYNADTGKEYGIKPAILDQIAFVQKANELIKKAISFNEKK